MSEHTQGPWSVETVKTSVGHAHKIMPISACLYVDHRDAAEKDRKTLEAAANARLIAAAPKLLKSLKVLVETYSGDDPARDAPILMMAREAIAEAEGKS